MLQTASDLLFGANGLILQVIITVLGGIITTKITNHKDNK